MLSHLSRLALGNCMHVTKRQVDLESLAEVEMSRLYQAGDHRLTMHGCGLIGAVARRKRPKFS